MILVSGVPPHLVLMHSLGLKVLEGGRKDSKASCSYTRKNSCLSGIIQIWPWETAWRANSRDCPQIIDLHSSKLSSQLNALAARSGQVSVETSDACFLLGRSQDSLCDWSPRWWWKTEADTLDRTLHQIGRVSAPHFQGTGRRLYG